MDASPAIAGLDEGQRETGSLDATAFAEGFQKSREGVFRYLRARCQTDDEAADLTAATFERAWRSRDRFRGDAGGYTPWVYQIARRMAIDAARKRSSARRGLIFWPPPDMAPDPADPVLRDEQDRILAGRLASLPDLQREVILLRFAGGLTARQIGMVIGKREDATQRFITRALGRLKEAYRDDE